MSQRVQAIKSLKLDKWFVGELGKPGSVPDNFWWSFTLHFALEKLSETSRETFLDLLENAGGEAAMEYAASQIPEFESNFTREFGKRLAGLKSRAAEENKENGGQIC